VPSLRLPEQALPPRRTRGAGVRWRSPVSGTGPWVGSISCTCARCRNGRDRCERASESPSPLLSSSSPPNW
jgi:hypothetical protein